MKPFLLFTLLACTSPGWGQNLQLHYDLRHTVAPQREAKNVPALYFEYYKTQDSGRHRIQPGAFLLKMQAEFTGDRNNPGSMFVQVAQTLRWWAAKVYANLEYKGGLGVTEPRQYSYYIPGAYSVGVSYPFRMGRAYLTGVLNYKYLPLKKRSHDATATLYWWTGWIGYRAEFSGDLSAWTENRNRGDDATRIQKGKRFFFFAEPQWWYTLAGGFGIGTKVNLYYHVLTAEPVFQAYPTVGLRYKF